PKPDLTICPIVDAHYVNKYMKAPKFSLPPMPELMRNVSYWYKFALKHLPNQMDLQQHNQMTLLTSVVCSKP
ncbi:hypothetical protein BG006_002475, partial [Podila minutissima]